MQARDGKQTRRAVSVPDERAERPRRGAAPAEIGARPYRVASRGGIAPARPDCRPTMSDPERLGGDAIQAAADRRQRAIGVESGAARAAVLGINDGLVTNTALILGVVGATDAGGVVQLAGFASLVAGACSMAVGEYVSMRAQVELLERLLNDERQAMQADPERERAVIRDTLEQHGFEPETAERASRELARNVDRALAVYSRAVLGVNPDELGSPWAAALSSFVAFAAGALIPLV